MEGPPLSSSAFAQFFPPTPTPPNSVASALPTTGNSFQNFIRPGVSLAAKRECCYVVGGDSNDAEETGKKASESLEVTPITLYASERDTDTQGDLISVNAQYISYPIRNGLIRVINQTSVTRCLLRRHENSRVLEMAFAPTSDNLLLSAGTDQNIVIWALEETEEQDEKISQTIHKWLPNVQAKRVKWHPSNQQCLAILTGGNQLFLTDISSVTANGKQNLDLSNISQECMYTSDMTLCSSESGEQQVNDLSFSPDGQHLVCGCENGMVYLYQIANANEQYIQASKCIYTFNGGSVNSTFFLREKTLEGGLRLVVGGEKNTILSLWDVPAADKEDEVPNMYQELTIKYHDNDPASALHDIAMNESNDFIFISDRSQPRLFAVHLSAGKLQDSEKQTMIFDNICEFSLSYPILSLTVRTREINPETLGQHHLRENSVEMQAYCIQTQAIQQYHIAASKCFLPPAPVVGTGASPMHPASRQPPPTSIAATAAPSSSSLLIPQHLLSSASDSSPWMNNEAQTVGAMTAEEEKMHGAQQSASESTDCPELGITANPASNGSPEDATNSLACLGISVSNNRGNGNSGGDAGSGVASTISERLNASNSVLPSSAIATPSSAAGSGGTSDGAGVRESGSSEQIPSLSPTLPNSSASAAGTASENNDRAIFGMMLEFFRRFEQQQNVREKRDKERMAALLGSLTTHSTTQISLQVEKAMKKEIQSTMVPAMGRIMLHTMENQFLKPVQQILTKQLPTILEKQICTTISETLENDKEKIVAQMVKDVKAPVKEAFSTCFKDGIIPSFQAATQKMMQQINASLVKGFENSASKKNDSQEQMQTVMGMQAQLKEMSDSITELTQSVKELQLELKNAKRSSNDGDNADENASEAGSMSSVIYLKESIQNLLNEKSYEAAFEMALGAQNVKLVEFVCKSVGVQDVFSGRPLKLSQMIILCLIQQLGSDITTDVTGKLVWLREALLVLNRSDPAISDHVPSVVAELQSQLDEVPLEFRDSQFTLLHHILKSIMIS